MTMSFVSALDSKHVARTPLRLARLQLSLVGLLFTAAVAYAGSSDDAKVLEHMTQELADAIAPGESAVWDRYTDPDLTYVSEDNEVKTKAKLLADLKPLPNGYSGTIKVTEYQMREFGPIAVATYIAAETELVMGHTLHAQYRTTDTWRKTRAGWRLIAEQILAVPKDPPAVSGSAGELDRYVGTYALSPATKITLRREHDHLVAEREGRAPQIWLVEVPEVFFTPGRPRTRHVFLHGPDGAMSGFADRREGEDLVWTRQ
jgi:ketosteroid isomerase-like protein